MIDVVDLAAFSRNPFFLSDAKGEWVRETLAGLDRAERVGQLLVLQSYLPTKRHLDRLLAVAPGGVFLGMGVLGFRGRQRKAVAHLQARARVPLLIAGDLEFGGFGGALNATCFATQLAVGATGDACHAERLGTVTGREGRAMGFNWTFSPVVDVTLNHQNPIVNVRAFGDRHDLVREMACAYVRAVQEHGLAATAKHWPGDGVDDRDQHLVTTCNGLPWEEWRASFGEVYRAVIAAGVKTVMSGHISLPAYHAAHAAQATNAAHGAAAPATLVDFPEAYLPATLSRALNVDLLRGELGFNGVVVSDATRMGGLVSHGARDTLLPRLIAAGCDVQLFATDPAREHAVLLRAVETGVISPARLEEAVARVLALKASLDLPGRRAAGTLVPPKAGLKAVATPEHKRWSRECARAGITLVKDTASTLPLTPARYRRLGLVRAGDFRVFSRKLPKLLKRRGFRVKQFKRVATLRRKVSKLDAALVVACEPGYMGKDRVRLDWKAIGGIHEVAARVPVVFASTANPFHLYEVPRLPTLVNAYCPHPRFLETLVGLLVGDHPWRGTSPVDPFCGLPDARS